MWFIGALASGYLADKVGRKYSVLIGSAVFTVGGILQATSTTFAQLYLGRIISGIAAGWVTCEILYKIVLEIIDRISIFLHALFLVNFLCSYLWYVIIYELRGCTFIRVYKINNVLINSKVSIWN